MKIPFNLQCACFSWMYWIYICGVVIKWPIVQSAIGVFISFGFLLMANKVYCRWPRWKNSREWNSCHVLWSTWKKSMQWFFIVGQFTWHTHTFTKPPHTHAFVSQFVGRMCMHEEEEWIENVNGVFVCYSSAYVIRRHSMWADHALRLNTLFIK